MSAAVSPVPRLTFFANDGSPLAGGFVYTYAAGTTTPQPTYSDEGLSVPISNPIVLNAAGRPQASAIDTTEVNVYLSAVGYKFVVKNSLGSTIYTADHIEAVSPNPVTSVSLAFPVTITGGGTGYVPYASSATTLTLLPAGTLGYRFTTQGAAAPVWAPEDNRICDGRLTLTTGTPVTTSDVTGATTIYFTPYIGNRIALYDGSAGWNVRAFSEVSVALGTLTSNLPYDVFIYDNAGTPTLRSPVAWTNVSTRATALILQDGIYVKTGATTDRYLGTFYTDSTTVTSDAGAGAAASGRHLWNYYNRVARFLSRTESTASWTYATSTVRQANGSTANQVQLVQGVAEDALDLSLTVTCANNNNLVSSVGIGIDSTTTYAVGQWQAGSSVSDLVARYCAIPAVGHHAYNWNEWSGGATSTFYSAFASAGSTMTGGLAGIWKS